MTHNHALAKAIDLKPDVILYKLNLAKVFMAQGKKEPAERILNQALAENGQDEKTRIGIASFWLSAREAEKAEDLIKDGLQISPDSFTYRLFLAEVYAKTRRLDESEMILRQAVELNPDPAHPEIIKTKIALAKINYGKYDCTVIITDHDKIDYRGSFRWKNNSI